MESCPEQCFLTTDFGLMNGVNEEVRQLFSSRALNNPFPLRFTEGRIVKINRGSMKIMVNLRHYQLDAHSINILSPGSIVKMEALSPDFDMQMIAFANEWLDMEKTEGMIQEYLYKRLLLHLPLKEGEELRFSSFFSLMAELVKVEPFRREVFRHLIIALFNQISYVRERFPSDVQETHTHQEQVFHKFIDLVNIHCTSERNVSFYADKLCLTPRYLNTLVRLVSHRTIMDWVNEAVILETKVLLKHTDKPVYQISDELNFPNVSFFCKFFKRITGMTPQKYRTWKYTPEDLTHMTG